MSQERFHSCIEACKACADACDRCAAACLAMENASDMGRCVALDIDCAAICRLAVGSMVRASDMAPTICEACAEICEVCAEECGQHQEDHCQDCAKACRRCAEECRNLSSSSTKNRHTTSGQQAHPH